MCNRYRFTEKIEALALVFLELNATKPGLTPRYNVAPTQQAPVVLSLDTQQAGIEMMRWGLLPSWTNDGKGGFFNARSETVAEKPAFRRAFRQRRCLVIAHGFYEWQTLPHVKQPWHFHRKGDELMCFAGLWEEPVKAGKSDAQDHDPGLPASIAHSPGASRTFTILTSTANPLIAPLHDRMPVILAEDAWRTWLDVRSTPEQLQPLLTPFDADAMESWRVTPRMNNARYESAECMKPFVADDLELKLW